MTVTHFYDSHGGGIERVAGQLNQQLASLGLAIIWAAGDGDPLPVTAKTLPLRCFNVIERLTGLPMPIPAPSAIRALLRAIQKNDVIIIHDALYLTSIVAVLAAQRAAKPVILIQHISTIPFTNKFLNIFMKFANFLITKPMIRYADQVVFISATTKKAFDHTKTKRPPILLFNGVDASIFQADCRQDRQAVRTMLGLSDNQKLILFVGRFVAKKGLTVLAALARFRPDLNFLLVGRGPIDPETWSLPNVTVLRDRTHESLGAVYNAADIFLLPSVGEGYPLVVQEAMACGLPVICGMETVHADPGAGTWLTGIDVDLAQPTETAYKASIAIESMAMDVAARIAMADYARRTYSWPHMAEGIVDILMVLT